MRLIKTTAICAVLTMTLVAHVGATPLPFEIAQNYVRNNPVRSILRFIATDFSRESNGDQNSFATQSHQLDHGVSPLLALKFIMTNQHVLPSHLRKILDLADADIQRKEATPVEKAEMFQKFVKDSIVNPLRSRDGSVALAKELNRLIGERFDRDVANWNGLSEDERQISASLLGLTAMIQAEPEYRARVERLMHIGSSAVWEKFKWHLRYASVGNLIPGPGVTEMSPQGTNTRFYESFLGDFAKLKTTIEADDALRAIVAHPFNGVGSDQRPLSPEVTLANYKSVLMFGTHAAVEEALARAEAAIPTAVDTTHRDMGFTKVMLDLDFANALRVAKQRFPDLSERIDQIRQMRLQLRADSEKIQVARERHQAAEAVALLDKTLQTPPQKPATALVPVVDISRPNSVTIAIKYVQTNPVGRVLSYISTKPFVGPRSYAARSDQFDHTVSRNLALENIMESPDDLTPHVAKILELAEDDISRRYPNSMQRRDQFNNFLRNSIVRRLKRDAASVTFAKELNRLVGERFDRDFSHWSDLSDGEKRLSVTLLGLAAMGDAGPEFHQRLRRLMEVSSSPVLEAFGKALNVSAGRFLPPLKPVPEGLTYSGESFSSDFIESVPALKDAFEADDALQKILSISWTTDNATDNARKPAEIALKYKAVFSVGNHQFIEAALTKAEAAIPSTVDTLKDGLGFTPVLLDHDFLAGLRAAEKRFPDLKARIDLMRQMRLRVRKDSDKIELARLQRREEEADAMLRKTLQTPMSCREIFVAH